MSKIKLEYHLKFNARNPRHLRSAAVIASVDKRYKSSFIALAVEQYMQTHPMGINHAELMELYRQTDRSYQPKATIFENIQKAKIESSTPSEKAVDVYHKNEATAAIDKAMDFYDIS